jgi:hypothetical protein
MFNHLYFLFSEILFVFAVIIEPIPIGQAAKDYINLYVAPTLLQGLTELCKEKPPDPYVRYIFILTREYVLFVVFIFKSVNLFVCDSGSHYAVLAILGLTV